MTSSIFDLSSNFQMTIHVGKEHAANILSTQPQCLHAKKNNLDIKKMNSMQFRQ